MSNTDKSVNNHKPGFLRFYLKCLAAEGAYFILGLILMVFLGVPFHFLSQLELVNYREYAALNSLRTNYKLTTGTIISVYADKSELIKGVHPNIIEYQFVKDMRVMRTKTKTLAKQKANQLHNGDNVVVLYNHETSMLQHIPPQVRPIEQILMRGIGIISVLLIPALLGFLLFWLRLKYVHQVMWLHRNGTKARGEVSFFKHHRENSYQVEYLYKPSGSNLRMRHRCKAHNYEQVGEKAIGEEVDIVYDPNHPTRTCINEL